MSKEKRAADIPSSFPPLTKNVDAAREVLTEIASVPASSEPMTPPAPTPPSPPTPSPPTPEKPGNLVKVYTNEGDLPNSTWDSAHLGDYLRKLAAKTAEDIWLQGLALEIEFQSQRGAFHYFVSRYTHLSMSTVARYRKVAQQLTREDVRGKSVKQVYDLVYGRLGGPGKTKEKKEKKDPVEAAVEILGTVATKDDLRKWKDALGVVCKRLADGWRT